MIVLHAIASCEVLTARVSSYICTDFAPRVQVLLRALLQGGKVERLEKISHARNSLRRKLLWEYVW